MGVNVILDVDMKDLVREPSHHLGRVYPDAGEVPRVERDANLRMVYMFEDALIILDELNPVPIVVLQTDLDVSAFEVRDQLFYGLEER